MIETPHCVCVPPCFAHVATYKSIFHALRMATVSGNSDLEPVGACWQLCPSGVGRTLPVVTMTEGEGVALANENICRMATMSADEASHWDELHMGWAVDRVNHSECYSDHGKHTNMAESYFSRLRRMVSGQHHHVSPQYLHQYANHAAWLEDNRRFDNGELARRLVANSLSAPVSRNWKGYWQRAA